MSALVITISKILCERIFFGFDYFTCSSVKRIISITGLFKGCFNFHPILVSVVIHWEFSLILTSYASKYFKNVKFVMVY